MLTQYRLTLCSDELPQLTPEWGYRLYSALLAQAPPAFSRRVHADAVTPVSQFLICEGAPVWTVTLLGQEAEAALGELLETCSFFRLEKHGLRLQVAHRTRRSVADVEELFRQAESSAGMYRLRFCTPAAFKSRGQYLNLPTSRLMVCNLVKKWNGSVPDCFIEDTDGAGLDAIAEGLFWREFALRSENYYLKGHRIPGFVGTAAVENQLSGFHRQLANALILFSSYAGVGIKTALGMGGVQIQ